jgi:hypothetical protein
MAARAGIHTISRLRSGTDFPEECQSKTIERSQIIEYSRAITQLTGFYFDQYSLIFLIQWILTLAALIYFLHLRKQAHDIRTASLLFGGFVGLTGIEWVRSTAVWERQFFATQIRYIFMYIIAFAALQTVYKFPQISNDSFEPFFATRLLFAQNLR